MRLLAVPHATAAVVKLRRRRWRALSGLVIATSDIVGVRDDLTAVRTHHGEGVEVLDGLGGRHGEGRVHACAYPPLRVMLDAFAVLVDLDHGFHSRGRRRRRFEVDVVLIEVVVRLVNGRRSRTLDQR